MQQQEKEDLDYAIRTRPENSRGIEIVITGWTAKGQSIKLEKIFDVSYIA